MVRYWIPLFVKKFVIRGHNYEQLLRFWTLISSLELCSFTTPYTAQSISFTRGNPYNTLFFPLHTLSHRAFSKHSSYVSNRLVNATKHFSHSLIINPIISHFSHFLLSIPRRVFYTQIHTCSQLNHNSLNKPSFSFSIPPHNLCQ